MNKQLPERPDLGQLKKQAKDLLHEIRAGQSEALARVRENERAGFALADAQRVIAREYGFSSWAKLKLHVETRGAAEAARRLIVAALHGQKEVVDGILREQPRLSRISIQTAAALGDPAGVRDWLRHDPALATQEVGGDRRWTPLLSACVGRVGGDDAARAECAKLLLAAGANPNDFWIDGSFPDAKLAVLYGATGVNNYPQTARVLLAAGANPNDGESIYHAAEHNHVECLEALVAAGGDISRRDAKWTNTPLYFLLGHAPRTGQAAVSRQGIFWLLDHGADPNVPSYEQAEVPLHRAINNNWDIELITRFLDRGANPNARRADGKSALLFAVCSGRDDVARLLVERGASDDTRPEHHFLGACVQGRRDETWRLLAGHPEWRSQLAPAFNAMLLGLAKEDNAAAIALIAELGFGIDQPAEGGERPLHWAAWHGRLAATKALIAAGADLDRPENRYHAPPLGWCAHGSLNCRAIGGDYVGVAEALAAAGAKYTKPVEDGDGAPEVVAVIRRYEKK
ncbi:MAG TPA: ankyrin repeat domain-containing protein [Lacunisphaera sp.]|nr:ankyrin repeat domain-containing protein [Lacunisphaera sp.]